MLDDTQRRAVIEESFSPWSPPIVLARKNGDLCFLVNYRNLNVTKKTSTASQD